MLPTVSSSRTHTGRSLTTPLLRQELGHSTWTPAAARAAGPPQGARLVSRPGAQPAPSRPRYGTHSLPEETVIWHSAARRLVTRIVLAQLVVAPVVTRAYLVTFFHRADGAVLEPVLQECAHGDELKTLGA